jgi:hypothetical protein
VLLAKIVGDQIVTSDGKSFALAECKARFG